MSHFARNRFAAACAAAGGLVERFLAVGPCRVRLKFAGPVLLSPLLAALERRLVPALDAPEHLTIHLWDTASTGVAVPVPTGAPVERRAMESRPEVVARHEPVTGIIRVLWPAGNEGWWQVPDAGDLHYFSRGAPLRELLHAALRRADAALLHAGAVGYPDRGVLLVGPGGSGKSTATAACLGSGLGFVSEDYTVITTDPVPSALALYSSTKLNDDSLGWISWLAPHVTNPVRGSGEKNLIQLAKACPERLLDACRLTAVLVVGRNQGTATEIRPVSRGEALRAVAASTIIQLRSAGAPELKQLAGVIQTLPCHRLLTGQDLNDIPRAINHFLNHP